MIQTIRPTMSMVKDLLPGMKESWIFNDCAVGETKYGDFVGLVVIRICESNDYYYGFTPKILPKISRRATIDSLDIASEIFDYCPDVFDKKVTWTNIKEGHRYA